jgi:acetyl-CoA carboxylase biotin carboxyl carrier protein
MGLSHEDVREILRIIDESDLDELEIRTEGFSLHVRKGASAGSGGERAAAAGAGPPPPAEPEPPPPAGAEPHRASPGENETDSHSRDGLVDIESPMLGTFYRAESPGADPFVEVGTEVGPDTTVCIIEVMKMMNSVPAGVTGTVEQVCPNNGELVEYGQPLFRVRPQ